MKTLEEDVVQASAGEWELSTLPRFERLEEIPESARLVLLRIDDRSNLVRVLRRLVPGFPLGVYDDFAIGDLGWTLRGASVPGPKQRDIVFSRVEDIDPESIARLETMSASERIDEIRSLVPEASIQEVAGWLAAQGWAQREAQPLHED